MLVTACTKNPYVRDVSDIPVDLTIQSFHKDIMDLSENFSEQKRLAISKKYGVFFESYNSQILKIGVSTDSAYAQRLKKLLHEDWIQELYTKTNQVFADTSVLFNQIHEELRYFKFYFPEKKIPNVCTFIGACLGGVGFTLGLGFFGEAAFGTGLNGDANLLGGICFFKSSNL